MDKENVIYNHIYIFIFIICMYKIENYSAIGKQGNPAISITWMKLEGIILSEISQREKDKYCMISFICEILKKKKKN